MQRVNLNIENVGIFVNKILSKLYRYKSIGFVNTYGNEWDIPDV